MKISRIRLLVSEVSKYLLNIGEKCTGKYNFLTGSGPVSLRNCWKFSFDCIISIVSSMTRWSVSPL